MAVTPVTAPTRWGYDDQGRLVCEFLEAEPEGWDSKTQGEWIPTKKWVVRLIPESVTIQDRT